MGKKAFWIAGLASFLPGICAAWAGERTVLTTLEWPPYTSEAQPKAGISADIITAAFAAEGVQVSYRFLPWNRAIDMAGHGMADGFFPAYARPPNPRWIVSQAIGAGPLYFVERKDHPIRWNTLDDLAHVIIGVDAGFVNTAEIDARLTDGRLHGDIAVSDEENLRKLANGRIDLAIIDGNVFRFESRKPDMAAITAKLRLEDRPLEDKALYVDFRNTEHGRHLCDLLNKGLQHIHASTPAAIASLQSQAMAP